MAYNLILPSWFAMTGIGVFSVGFNVVAGLHKDQDPIESKPADLTPSLRNRFFDRQRFISNLPNLAGAFAMVAVLFLGNLFEVRVLWKYLPQASSISGSSTSYPLEHVGAFIGGAIQVLTGQSSLPGNNGNWYFDASRP